MNGIKDKRPWCIHRREPDVGVPTKSNSRGPRKRKNTNDSPHYIKSRKGPASGGGGPEQFQPSVLSIARLRPVLMARRADVKGISARTEKTKRRERLANRR